MKVIYETLENIRNNPFKSAVTFLSVGVGVGILIFALSISQLFNNLLEEKVAEDGQVFVVSNTELQSDGTYDRVRPAQLDMNAPEIVVAGVDGIELAETVGRTFWNEVYIDGKKYNLRNVVGSGPQYLDIMGLDLLAGEYMTENMVNKGAKQMWLSEEAAILLFGSTDAALGKQVQTPTNAGPGRREARTTPPVFTVAGVFANPDDLKLSAYGVADVLVPYSSMLPDGLDISRVSRFLANTFIVKVKNNDNAEGQIRSVLGAEYGDDLELNVWEGTLQEPSTILEETRQSVKLITTIINVLGFILLVSGAIGILSIMLVEIIAKNRDISLERALGASIPMIVQKYLAQALVLSAISGVIGIILAYFFAAPLASIVASIFDGFSTTDISHGVISLGAVAIGFISALIFGGVFGVLPLVTIVKRPIAEGIRDA
jgi:putative ABC transport system permease protein